MTKMEPFYQLRPRDNMRFGKGEVRGYFLTVFILTGFFICFGQEIIDNDISISESKPTLLLSHSRPHVNYLVLSSRILRPNTIYKVSL